MNRRTFYERAIFALSAVIGALTSIPALGYLLGPSRSQGAAGWTEAGAVDQLPDGVPHELVVQRKRVDAWKTSVERSTAWVVRRGQDVVAYSPQCTHLGCGYRWIKDSDHFLCPCHDSTFAIGGEVTAGPAPRPLDRLQVRVESGRLWLGPVESADEG
jgi:menaquinol-cytochrome c reductase iron-sulfur subunit